MTKIKLCGLTRKCDIEYANELMPDYIGFVFAEKSKRYIAPERALALRQELSIGIIPVGVFVNEAPDVIARLLKQNVIGAAQLHGDEDESYISNLRGLTRCPIIKAFRTETKADIEAANQSSADYVLLDSGGGTGTVFDWELLNDIKRPYFLAGGLTPENVGEAVKKLSPYGVDASSSLETNGLKDKEKMAAFAAAVRKD